MFTEKTDVRETLIQYSNIVHYMGGMKWDRNDTRMEKKMGHKWSKGNSRLGHKGTKGIKKWKRR